MKHKRLTNIVFERFDVFIPENINSKFRKISNTVYRLYNSQAHVFMIDYIRYQNETP